ncbi:MAG: flagellar hook-associated protein FlgL [Marmoricola sp.]
MTRITQRMMSDAALVSIQTSLTRLSKTQEQITTGKVLNRPSDSPTDTTTAMRLRASIAQQKQFARNASDGQGWLNLADSTLQGVNTLLARARDLALQGANASNDTPAAREALATEVDQIRQSVLAAANTTYLDRPLFGGVTGGSVAFAVDGTGTIAYVGTPGDVTRAIGPNAAVPVNVDGAKAFGPDGGSVFDDLASLSNALRSGDTAGITTALGAITTSQSRVQAAVSDVGARENRVDKAVDTANDAVLALTTQLSSVEDVDIAKATVDMQSQQVAYQAALAVTAKVVQPSLLDFLR